MKKMLVVLCLFLTMVSCAEADNTGLSAGEYHSYTHGNITPEQSGNFKYIVLANNSAEIVDYTGDAIMLEVPAELNGITVTSIGQQAFFWCDSLVSITLPDTLTTIGERAFGSCDSLVAINIPDSISCIGDYAFSGCGALTSIGFPDSLLTIGQYAFSECDALSEITIPGSVTTIGDYAFNSCDALTSLTVSSGVTTIGDYAFYFCSSLTSVNIPSSVTSIGQFSFAYCADAVFMVDANSEAERYVMDHGGTFFSAAEGFWTCNDCLNYTDGNICTVCHPEAQKAAGAGVDSTSSELWSYFAPAAGQYERSTSNPFIHVKNYGNYWYITLNDNSLEILRYSGTETNLTIPAMINGVHVSSIGNYAFHENSFLVNVIVPDGVTTIAHNAFEDCSSMISISLPDSVATIAGNAFNECRSLISITIPQKVTEISYNMFWQCDSLTTVNLPEQVTRIGDLAFSDCPSLASISIPENISYISRNAFSNCPNLRLIVSPDSYAEQYAQQKNIPFSYSP